MWLMEVNDFSLAASMPNGDKLEFYVQIQIFNHAFLVSRLEWWYLICEQSKNLWVKVRSMQIKRGREVFFHCFTSLETSNNKCDWIELSLSKYQEYHKSINLTKISTKHNIDSFLIWPNSDCSYMYKSNSNFLQQFV